MKKTAATPASRITASTIVTLRAKSGLSQAAFAKKIGYSTSYVSMLERAAREPTLSTLFRIAKAFKVPVVSLITE